MQRRLPEIREDAGNGLSALFRTELHQLDAELRHSNERVAHYDQQIDAIAEAHAGTQFAHTSRDRCESGERLVGARRGPDAP